MPHHRPAIKPIRLSDCVALSFDRAHVKKDESVDDDDVADDDGDVRLHYCHRYCYRSLLSLLDTMLMCLVPSTVDQLWVPSEKFIWKSKFNACSVKSKQC